MSKFEMLKSNMHFLFGVAWFLQHFNMSDIFNFQLFKITTFSTFQLSTLQLLIILNISTLEHQNYLAFWSLGRLIGGQMIGGGTNIVYTRFPWKSKPEMLSKGPRGSKVPKRPRAVCVFAPGSHGMQHGLMGEIHATVPKSWWNESVCFKSQTGLQNPKRFQKTRNHMRRQSRRTRWLKHGSASYQNRCPQLIVYPRWLTQSLAGEGSKRRASQFN